MRSIPLPQLSNGQRARVTRLRTERPVDQRLLAFGLMPGAVLEFSASAPLGDPIAVFFQNQCVSLRRAEAFSVEVELLETPASTGAAAASPAVSAPAAKTPPAAAL